MFGLSLTSIKLIAMFAGAVILAVFTATITHKVDLAKYNQLLLNYSQAQVKVVQQAKLEQAAQDQIALNSAVDEATAQQKIVVQMQMVEKEVLIHVPDTINCITYGVLRVLDASARGVDPDSVPLPPGELDGTCAGVTPSTLVTIIADNYAIARANAEQLTALQAFIRAVTAESQKDKTP
jgi:hypothetical protein